MDPVTEKQLDNYTDLLDMVRHHRQSFQRQVTTAVYHLDDGMVLVVATLSDTYHDMRMAIHVDTNSREIADIRAVMLRYPFNLCPESTESYRQLIGLKLFEPGTMNRIHELIPRREGCTHLYHVLESCLRALFIGGRGGRKSDSVYEEKIKTLTNEQRRIRGMENPHLKGSCLSFSAAPRPE